MTVDELVTKISRSTQHRYLYHFTDKSDFSSIAAKGFLSKAKMREEGWWPDATGGNQLSWDLDALRGIDGYVNLCMTTNPLMKYLAQKDGRLPEPRSFNVPHLYRRSYSRFLSPMASRTWIAQCSRSSPCHTFFVPGSCCREEGCDPTSRPRSMTTALMSGAFPSDILTTFR